MRTIAEFAGTTNLQILLAAGVRPATPNNEDCDFTLPCPYCDKHLRMRGDRLRCEAPDCEFGTARIVDFLAAQLKGYQEIRKFMVHNFPNNSRDRVSGELGSFLNQAETRHWLRGLVRKGIPEQGVVTARLLTLLRKKGYARLATGGNFHAMDSKILRKMRDRRLDVPSDPCLAVPLWSPDGEFGGFAFLTKPLKVVRFGEDPVLTAWRPSRIGDLDFSGALAAAELAVRDGRPVVPPAFAFPTSSAPAHRFNIRSPKPNSFVELGLLLRQLPDLHVDNQPVGEWFTTAVQQGCTPGMSTCVRRLLEACPPTTALQFKMEQALLAAGKLAAASELRAMSHSRELFRQGQGAVQVSPGGYVLTAADEEIRLTNFSLVLHDNLVFDDLSDVWHTGTLESSGNRWVVTLNSGELANTAKLEHALRGQSPAGSALPTVLEPAKVAKILLPWWRRQVAELPQKIGVSSIGWSPDRRRFQGAGWYVDLDKVTQEPVIFRPDVAALRVFDSGAAAADMQLVADLPPAARDMVAMLAATLCRVYVRSKVIGVTIQNSNPARNLCGALFRAFGQKGAYEMNSNLRNHTFIAGIAGHPLLAVGYNPLQAASCRLPCFFLTEQGYSVEEGDYRAVTLTARWILQRVVSWLLATEGASFEERRAFHYQVSLIKEGTAAIAAACKMDPWEVSPPSLPYLEALVAPRSAATIGEIMKIREGDVVIATNNPGDLVAELLAAGMPATRDGSHVAVPVLQLSPLLADYFGESPCFA